jgi:hypothetical protein
VRLPQRRRHLRLASAIIKFRVLRVPFQSLLAIAALPSHTHDAAKMAEQRPRTRPLRIHLFPPLDLKVVSVFFSLPFLFSLRLFAFPRAL